jgi:hypothetical protein
LSRDWVLVEWAAMANRGQLRDVEVTFQCGGLVLCGTLISGREYFEGIGRLAVAGLREAERSVDVTDAFAELFAEHAARQSQGEVGGEGPEYLHFKDVQLLLGCQNDDASATLEVPYWRVRIETVEGFLLGGAIRRLPRSSVAGGSDEDRAVEREA